MCYYYYDSGIKADEVARIRLFEFYMWLVNNNSRETWIGSSFTMTDIRRYNKIKTTVINWELDNVRISVSYTAFGAVETQKIGSFEIVTIMKIAS